MESRRPKKSLGQNFLVDRNVLARIVQAVNVKDGDRILEVGPGHGALTNLLAEKSCQVIAVEIDSYLVEKLRSIFGCNPAVTIVHQDILRTDLNYLLSKNGTGLWKVAANLPYNISSQVLFLFLQNIRLFDRLVLMLQKEVGERLLAKPGSKEYGILTVLLQLHFKIRREFLVRPGAFYPVPKVDSLVLSFETLSAPLFDVGDEDFFRRVVKASFGQRRKTLINCLKAAGLCHEVNIEAVNSVCAIDLQRRGETLSLEEFALLSRTLYSYF